MLGDINPQTVKITAQAVVYPGRDHVTVLNVKRFSGRQYSAVDLSALTRAVLVFPQTDPVIAYDTDTAPAGTITWAGSDITIDLSDFSMPASVQSSYLIVYDAEHLGGQVLVDDNDSVVEFDFRNVSATGIVQPPVLELVSEAPADNDTYGRKNGTWVSIDSVVAGVSSVNGETGTVVLDAADVGADPAGTAAAAVAAHVGLADPHTQYFTQSEGDARYEAVLVAGTNVTIDRTDPENPVINASGGGGSGDVVGPASAVNNGVALFDGTTGDLIKDGGALGTAAFDATEDFAPAAHVGAGGTAHANAVAAGDAGFMTGADKTKLDGIATGAQVNVGTDLSATHGATTVVVASSTGDDATLLAATATEAGAMTAADKVKLDGIAAGAQVNVGTNLTATHGAATVVIASSTGDDATLLAATASEAGAMTAADKTKLDGVDTGATANSSDATLLDRANHTGVQAISTVTGLQTALDSKTGLPAVATFTGNKTLALTDINTYNVSQDGTAQTVNLPAQATVAWTADAEIHIEQGGAGTVTITGATGVTVNGVSAGSFALAGQFSVVTLKRVASNSWTLIGGVGNGTREVLTADRTYYVRTDGSDANDGLTDSAGGAFLTVQRGVDVATSRLDAGNFQVTVQVRDGTYTGAIVAYPMLGNKPLIIRGNATTTANVHLNVTGIAVSTTQGSAYTQLFDMKVTGSVIALSAQPAGIIDFGNLEFGASSSRHLNAQFFGFIGAIGNYTISGGAAAHINALQGGAVRLGVAGTAITITLVGAPSFSSAFVVSGQGPSLITLASTIPTFSGSATGKRYDASLNAVINTFGQGATYFPGDVAGTTATGGQYA